MGGRHIFTVDLEEYFQAEGFQGVAPPEEWASLPSRVERCVDQILSFLERYDVLATFFVNAWLATEHPDLIRRITETRHELAAQGRRPRAHEDTEDLERYREDVEKTKQVLEDISGREILGFRSPRLSIPEPAPAALEVLAQAGFYYDSSLLPTGRELRGYSGISSGPHLVRRGEETLLELPLTTHRLLGVRLPAQGGLTFRQLPLAYTEWALRAREAGAQPAVFRIRAWEIDRFQPRLPVSPMRKLRHYWGLGRVLPRLERLVSKFEFTSVERYFHLPYQDWDESGPPVADLRTDPTHRRCASQS